MLLIFFSFEQSQNIIINDMIIFCLSQIFEYVLRKNKFSANIIFR